MAQELTYDTVFLDIIYGRRPISGLLEATLPILDFCSNRIQI